MIVKVPLIKYLENEEYKEIPNKHVWVRLKTNPHISFNIVHLPETFIEEDGKKIVMPKYYNDFEMFMDRFREYEPYLENFEIELDTTQINTTIEHYETESKNNNEYINIDEYYISDKMHWFNQEVLKFYKDIHSQRVVLTSDITKTRSLFKNKVCSDDGKPIEYRTLLRLFDMTGVSDESFKNFVTRKGSEKIG